MDTRSFIYEKYRFWLNLQTQVPLFNFFKLAIPYISD